MNKQAFFNTVKEFISGMMTTFPEIRKQLTTLETCIDIGENTMPNVVIEKFMNEIGPHYKYIIDKDETYFRSMNYNDIFEQTCSNYSPSDRIKTLIDSVLRFIGQEWEDRLSMRTKQQIWNYLQGIILMGAGASPRTKYEYIITYASKNAQ